VVLVPVLVLVLSRQQQRPQGSDQPPPHTCPQAGATRPEVVLRHFATKPGKVYNLRQAKSDIDSVYSTGLFDDVNIIPNEADDSTEQQPKVGGGALGAGVAQVMGGAA
jgi:hypothetical protein